MNDLPATYTRKIPRNVIVLGIVSLFTDASRQMIYPVIKQQGNSFVFEVKTNPEIFLYLDPAKSRSRTNCREFHPLSPVCATKGSCFQHAMEQQYSTTTLHCNLQLLINRSSRDTPALAMDCEQTGLLLLCSW